MMFTGIVEEVGKVEQIRHGQYSAVLIIRAEKVLRDAKVGDSIAVNGICLTITELFFNGFSADIMHETLNRSSMANLKHGSRVNLERAMLANRRFGGHIVTGHVDGVGKIIRIQRDDTAIWYTIQTKPQIMRYVIEKGSVTVDGISLTVASITQTDFSVSAIPHTINQTILKERREGDVVNLETDIIGKYVEKLLYPVRQPQVKNTITKEFLSQHGF